MNAFDELPPTVRSLLVTKADLEIVTAGCVNILQLAHKRNQTVDEVWHDICQKSGQPRCSMPPRIMDENYAAKPIGAATASISKPAVAAQPKISGNARPASTAKPAVAPHKPESALAATTAVRPKSAPPARQGRHAPAMPAILAVGSGALFVVGIGVYAVVANLGPAPMARPTETIRIEHARDNEANKPATGSITVPAPQGTIRRMEAISKAFSNNK